MKNIIVILVGLLLVSSLTAQTSKLPDSYNYTRGVEALKNEKIQEGLEYLNKEVEENPKNGYAFAWIASVRNIQEEYGRALTSANLAVKHIPKKDNTYKAWAHSLRAEIYAELGEKDKAFEDYATAINFTPEDEELYEKRGQLYYELEQYDLANKDYHKITLLDPGSVMGYMGLGRNANKQKQYDEAIAQFDYVVKLSSDYSGGYSYRAESYTALKKYNEAIDDIIKSLTLDYNEKAFYLMIQVADSAFMPLAAKLKVQTIKNPNEGYWPYCLGLIHEYSKQFKKAISYFKASAQIDNVAMTAYRLASCYEELGDYTTALQQMEMAIKLDPADYDYVMRKAHLLYESGNSDEAIVQLGIFINKYPEYYGGYYRRGFYKDNTKDVDGAIEDYSMTIALEPSFAYAYLGRADMYKERGDLSLSEADYRKVIELDTMPQGSSCAQFAFLELGQKEEAVNFMNRVIAEDEEDVAGNYYNATCLYSRMGETDKALEAFKIALENGYSRFSHMDNDDDLDGIRNLPLFKELMLEYREKYKLRGEDMTEQEEVYEDEIVEIPFEKMGTMLKVECKINNLPLHFIFDTGASNVSISNVEANFMLKNNYLTSRDVQGTQNYITADGSISEGTVINLRHVEFGGLELPNIKASIVKNQIAPLLLGQSILEKLGKIEIDNEKRLLKITYRKKMIAQ